MAGFLLLIPVIATYVVVRFFTDFVVQTLRPGLATISSGNFSWITKIPVQLTALTLALLFLYIVGMITTTVIGRRLEQKWHGVVEGIPVVRPIYRIVRQAVGVFSGGTVLQSSKVVLLQYPRQGVLSMGLVTGTYPLESSKVLLTIYIPTIPNPTSGFLAIVEKEQVIETDLTFEDAMKIVVSAGLLTEEVVQSHIVK